MNTAHILYLGTNENFADEVKEYAIEIGFEGANQKLEVFYIDSNLEAWNDEFFSKCCTYYPNIIYLDFTNAEKLEQSVDELTASLMLLKNHYKLRSTPIFGLFATKAHMNEMRYLFSCGMIYAHIMSDSKAVFRDSFYMGFEQGVYFPRYAKGRNIDLKHNLGLVSTLPCLSIDMLTVESDVEMVSGEEARVYFGLFDDFTPTQFQVVAGGQSASFYNFIYQSKLKIPYAGPWDEIDENTMYKATMETWIDLNQSKFDEKHSDVLIIDERSEILKGFKELNKEVPIRIHYRSFFNDRFSILETLRPPLIMVNIVEHEDDGFSPGADEYLINDHNMLSRLTDFVKILEEYYPLIVVFGSLSGTEALQKVMGYSRIMVIPKPLDITFAGKMLAVYEKNEGDGEEDHFFRHEDVRRHCLVDVEVIVTSITEHELTFICEKEIPYYSVFTLDVPIQLYVTVIPTLVDLPTSSKGTHYMGFINGAGADDLQLIRQFVNRIIHKPLQEFKFTSVEQEELKKMQEEMAQKKLSAEEKKAQEQLEGSKEEEIETFTVQRQEGKLSKSKL